MTALLQPTKVEAPANAMAHCQPPVAHIATLADAYDAAVLNASRLNDCIIRHDGLIGFENARLAN